MKPFYSIPFCEGKWYESLSDIPSLFDSFAKGEKLLYLQTAHSIYDGKIGFFFKDANGNDRRWDIDDGLDPDEEVIGKFLEVKDNHPIDRTSQAQSGHG